ncbi:unnamed protein product [Arabidopsis halleri]
MSDLRRDLVLIVLQFLEEEKLLDSMHRLEKETGYIFNLQYFKEKFIAGEWDEVESYLRGFINVNDNDYTRDTFFQIWKVKYIEALERKDKTMALHILRQDLGVFSDTKQYKELTQLLTLQNIMEHEELSQYERKAHRKVTLDYLETQIQENPLLHGKLAPPSLAPATLRTLARRTQPAPSQNHSLES